MVPRPRPRSPLPGQPGPGRADDPRLQLPDERAPGGDRPRPASEARPRHRRPAEEQGGDQGDARPDPGPEIPGGSRSRGGFGDVSGLQPPRGEADARPSRRRSRPRGSIRSASRTISGTMSPTGSTSWPSPRQTRRSTPSPIRGTGRRPTAARRSPTRRISSAGRSSWGSP